MAVPKKKISYSRTRRRFLAKYRHLKKYNVCTECQNFISLHTICSFCDRKEDLNLLPYENVNITNIHLYDIKL